MRPETVTIIGQPFAIKWVEEKGELSDGDNLGRTHVSKQRISITTDQGDDQMRDTMIHELLHASLGMLGVLSDREEQERVVAALSPVVLNILRANPDVTKWLTA